LLGGTADSNQGNKKYEKYFGELEKKEKRSRLSVSTMGASERMEREGKNDGKVSKR